MLFHKLAQVGVLSREKHQNTPSNFLSIIMGGGGGNTCSSRGWEWHGRDWIRISCRIHEVLDRAIPVHTVSSLFWNDDRILTASANTSRICCVNSNITVVVCLRSGGCPSNIKLYQWMHWTDPLQYAILMNKITAISFYCDTKNSGSEWQCLRLTDGSYV